MAEKAIIFTMDTGEEISFQVLAQTMLAGQSFLLVTEPGEEEEGTAYILRELTDDQGQLVYEEVQDDVQLEALSGIFEEILDVEIQ